MSIEERSTKQKHQSKSKLPVLPILALIFAGEAIFFLPFVIPRIFRPTVLAVFEINNTQLGAFFSLYGIIALVSYLIGGPLADRFAPSKLISVALFLTAAGGVCLVLFPFSSTMLWLYGFWGMTTILLFWAALLRTTRIIGGETQGLAFGLLDGGRGLIGAVAASIGVWIFSYFIQTDLSDLQAADRRQAFIKVILFFVILVILAGVFVYFSLRSFDKVKANTKPKIQYKDVLRVMKLPQVRFQAIIILCAYCGYKATDDFSLLAQDVLGYDEVQAASVGTLGFWIRPIAAIAAGYLADKVSSSKMIMYCFALMSLSSLLLSYSMEHLNIAVWIIFVIMTSSAGVYALRGLYFAIMEELEVPLSFTGTAIGVVSIIGFTPDIFMGPLMGFLLDRSPGVDGHRHLFLFLFAIAFVGFVSSVLCRRYILRHLDSK